ncbi:MAG: restriction endonuclease subunit S [Muribaculaceae bacterium]|nr:restriction endonuclease subunit S [Muribaculaceae bacterium]
MKHNWEYKRLGEVCEIKYGTRIVAKDTEPGDYKVYGGGGATFSTKFYNREDCMIVSRFAMSSNCVRFVKGKFFLNDSGLTVKSKTDNLLQEYVEKFLWASQDIIYNFGRGLAQKNLDVKKFLNLPVFIPLIEVQEQIVAELDALNEGIAELREQVKDLDSLAKTLFYETFGDPISNPKAWPLKKLIEIAPIQPSTTQPHEVNNKYWLLNLDQIESNTGRIIEIQYFGIDEIGNSTTTFDSNNVLYSKLRPYLNKVVTPNDVGFCSSELLTFRPLKAILNREYLAFSLRTNEFVNFINEKTGGAKMPRVKMDFLRNLNLPLPPLALQQQFAAQIEEIEAMKRELEVQIAEAQTLLDSRMDYWFN